MMIMGIWEVLMAFSRACWHGTQLRGCTGVSQVLGASCTVMNHEYVMLMSTENASATGRVQCVWSDGEKTLDRACK